MNRFNKITGCIVLAIFVVLVWIAHRRGGQVEQNILWTIFGVLVGVPISVFVNVNSSRKFEETKKLDLLQAVTDRKTALEVRPTNVEIVTLELNAAFYDLEGPQRGISIRETNKALFFAVPDKILALIRHKDPDFASRPPEFLGYTDLASLESGTGVAELERLILNSIDKVALSFLDSFDIGNQPKFNNTKFGVDSIHFTRVGPHERSSALLNVYSTDYFTHSVMRQVYRSLRTRNDPYIHRAITEVGNSRYSCLLTSLGVNAMVTIEGGTLCVLCRRSNAGLHSEAHGVWHVSMNEAFSETDRDPDSPSLKCCLSRGLREELGWEEGTVDFTASFHEFWYWKTAGEVGITAVVKAYLTVEEFIEYSQRAIDQNRERFAREFKFVSYNESAIREFLISSLDTKGNIQLSGAARHVLGTLAMMGCP